VNIKIHSYEKKIKEEVKDTISKSVLNLRTHEYSKKFDSEKSQIVQPKKEVLPH